jgi:4-amino-4-deoxychorismate lyase
VSGQTAIWLNGNPAGALPLPDRGLDFGDGLFETLLLHAGEALYPDFHLRRLQRGLHALSFPDCVAAVEGQLHAVVAQIATRGWRRTALRLTITRGSGPRGYAPPIDAKPRTIMIANELGPGYGGLPVAATLSLANVRWPTQPALAGLKHLNRLEQVLAARQCRADAVDEVVMLDQDENVISVAAGNLFVVTDGHLLTPSISHCGIAGTRRELVIQRWAPAIGLQVAEQAISLAQVETAQEVFYSNSLVGLRPVKSFGAARWESHPICDALYRQYEGEIP